MRYRREGSGVFVLCLVYRTSRPPTLKGLITMATRWSSTFYALQGHAVGSICKNGRECAAWLGVVPRQHSTGGKPRLLAISTRGDRSLRKLLIHEARSVVRTVEGKQDGRSRWLQGLIVRRGKNRAGVAQANKTARVAWVILAKGERYRPAA